MGCASGRHVGVSTTAPVGTPAKLTTCPICFEEKDDISPLQHWENIPGDVSGHAMCAGCLGLYKKDVCPFCKELLFNDDVPAFVAEFVRMVAANVHTGDPNLMAMAIERWQLYEMQHEETPRVLHQVCRLVLEDASFAELLDDGVANTRVWLRNTAGIIFRFQAMHADGHLKGVPEHTAADLDKAVEVICRPLEEGPVDATLSPHHYGALYMQAVVPWLCAFRSGDTTDTLKAVVRRIGRLVARAHDVAEQHHPGYSRMFRALFRERVHPTYIELSHVPVWGSKEEDLVWTTILAPDSTPVPGHHGSPFYTSPGGSVSSVDSSIWSDASLSAGSDQGSTWSEADRWLAAEEAREAREASYLAFVRVDSSLDSSLSGAGYVDDGTIPDLLVGYTHSESNFDASSSRGAGESGGESGTDDAGVDDDASASGSLVSVGVPDVVGSFTF